MLRVLIKRATIGLAMSMFCVVLKLGYTQVHELWTLPDLAQGSIPSPFHSQVPT
jgi:hypothetical protein